MGGKFRAGYRVGALRTLCAMGCREGSRGTDFPIRDPGWMAQNGTEPAGL